MGNGPEATPNPVPEGYVVLPVALRAYPEKLEFHMAATDVENGVMVEAHREEGTGGPLGFTVHFHGLAPSALAETLRCAVLAAEELEAQWLTHKAQHRAEEN